MSSGPNQYYPSMPANLDPRVAQMLEHLFDRVNYLLTKVSEGSRGDGGKGIVPTQRPSGLSVSIAAASDPLLGGSTLASAGDTNFVGQAVPLTATGVGFSISGTTTSGVISVSNAATARAALGITLPTGVAAHTITIPKLTGGGANGSISWDANGWITAFVDPT